MADLIMVAGGVVFAILFLFLFFIFTVFVSSLFIKRKTSDFEPSVSIIIPAYNEEENIGKCLDAVEQSDYPKEKLDILVVDDGSTDSTIRIAESKGARVLRQGHEGKSAALTEGARRAKHDFVFTLDADTIIEKHCLRELVRPFAEEDVGATTGNSRVSRTKTIAEIFQNIEYHYNNLIRTSFSRLFDNGIWFFGALACYRKSVLEQIGYFKTDTLAEDMDTALEIKRAGLRTVNVHNAIGMTVVPPTLRALYRQRARWWMGTLQSLGKNRMLFSRKSSMAIKFLFINQFWWSFYAFLSLPLIIYQVNYWLPSNSQDLFAVSGYLFRWFTLSGPAYVIYKIPEWGISWYSIFGVLSGIISAVMIVAAIRMFSDKVSLKNLAALFFYFPYTIILNIFIFLSILTYPFSGKRYFIK